MCASLSLGLFCVGDTGNELTVLQENYAILCNTMTDIDNLLKYFVTERIITMDEEEKIKQCVTRSDKVRMLLLNISGPLKAGNESGYYVMLKVMKKYGTDATQKLAVHMESCTEYRDSSIHELPEESPKSMYCFMHRPVHLFSDIMAACCQ